MTATQGEQVLLSTTPTRLSISLISLVNFSATYGDVVYELHPVESFKMDPFGCTYSLYDAKEHGGKEEDCFGTSVHGLNPQQSPSRSYNSYVSVLYILRVPVTNTLHETPLRRHSVRTKLPPQQFLPSLMCLWVSLSLYFFHKNLQAKFWIRTRNNLLTLQGKMVVAAPTKNRQITGRSRPMMNSVHKIMMLLLHIRLQHFLCNGNKSDPKYKVQFKQQRLTDNVFHTALKLQNQM